MAVKSMEMAVATTASMEMALGALPRPGRVLEQRLLSPEICLRRWRHCGTVLGKTLIHLGVSVGRLYIGGEAASEGDQGGHTTPWRGQEGGAPPSCVPALCPPSGSLSVFVLCPGKIAVSAFVSSNSENISCVAFLKHKNSRKQAFVSTTLYKKHAQASNP
jgi:hypothetical protein